METSDEKTENPFLSHALQYASLGWHVFPCRPRARVPLTRHGFKDSTLDPEQIKRWWRRWPNANVAIATGEVVVVVDLDKKRGKDGIATMATLVAVHGALPKTPTSRTGGGGLHYAFLNPGGLKNRTNILPGIDVRAEGGYVVVPPSIHPGGGTYLWEVGPWEPVAEMPRWLADLLLAEPGANGDYPHPERAERTDRSRDTRPFGVLPEREHELMRSALAAIPASTHRDEWRNVGMALHSTGIPEAFGLWDSWSSTCPEKYHPREMKKQWASFKPTGGITLATLYEVAKRYGWTSPPAAPRLPEAIWFDPEIVAAVKAAGPEPTTANPAFNELLWEPMPAWPESDNPTITALNQRHFFTLIGGKACVCQVEHNPETRVDEIGLSRPQDFVHRYRNRRIQQGEGKKAKQVSISDFWLQHPDRREYPSGLYFLPGQPSPPGVFNLFLGLPVRPAAGPSDLYWTHLRDVICSGNDTWYAYFRKWLAQIFQHPVRLSRTSIVVVGAEGAGKGAVADRVGDLLGPYYLALSRMDRVSGKFNAHLGHRLLVYANEATWGGDKHNLGALKALITDEWSDLERKGFDVIRSRNVARFLVNSNERWAVPQGMGDRRFLFLECSNARCGDRDYFRKLYAQAASPAGLSAILYDLLSEDLTGWDATDIPTEGTPAWINKLRSSNSVTQWWWQVLRDGYHVGENVGEHTDQWVTEPPRTEMYEHFCAAVRCSGARWAGCSSAVFGRELRDITERVGSRKKMVRVPGSFGQSQNLERRCYVLRNLDNCREFFRKMIGAPENCWDADVDDCPF